MKKKMLFFGEFPYHLASSHGNIKDKILLGMKTPAFLWLYACYCTLCIRVRLWMCDVKMYVLYITRKKDAFHFSVPPGVLQ